MIGVGAETCVDIGGVRSYLGRKLTGDIILIVVSVSAALISAVVTVVSAVVGISLIGLFIASFKGSFLEYGGVGSGLVGTWLGSSVGLVVASVIIIALVIVIGTAVASVAVIGL